ncbi:hypothetical protein RFI_29044 [Reticulomyxa filosa]|uniref:MIF4G domain-containing protein n=1 Tax=Reticulomyxa filosa TaxID=46433 RepID=X6M4F4_RETFI|nr:hypothetical protein RFI_29044 [Reticulomyxa filosa]|eukprot:ETO08347.1 hypothetical protein RFI_29044 [Reticulomyxa filosa]
MSVIGEFYNRKLMEENEITSLMAEMLHKKDSHVVMPLDIEALCALLQQCGKALQRQTNTRKAMEQALAKMINLSNSMETRIRFRVDEINAIINKKEPFMGAKGEYKQIKDARGGGRSKAGGSSQDLRYQAKRPQETPTASPAKEKGSQLSWTTTTKTSETQPLPPQDMSKKLLKSFKEAMDAMEQTYVLDDAIDFVKENINELTSRNWANLISYVCLKWKKDLIEPLFLRWVAEILKQSLLPSQKFIEIVGELSRSFAEDKLDYPLLGQWYGNLFALLSKHDPTVNYAAKFEEMKKQNIWGKKKTFRANTNPTGKGGKQTKGCSKKDMTKKEKKRQMKTHGKSVCTNSVIAQDV